MSAPPPTEKRYFIAATSHKFPDTWDRCKEMGSWGATKKLEAIQRVQAGDEFLVWLGRKGFAATGMATGPFYVATEKDPAWQHMGKEYPYRFHLHPIKDYGSPYLVKFKDGRDSDTGLTAMRLVFGFTEIDEGLYRHYVERLEAVNSGDTPLAPVLPSPLSVAVPEAVDIEPPDDAEQQQESLHNLAQLRLLQTGVAVGAKVWVAANDRHRTVQGVKFSDLSLDDLTTPGLSVQAQKVVRNIDVIWLNQGEVVAAFEIESTTSIYSGLLRLSDLVASHPYANIALYIVSPESQRDAVCAQLKRPTFERLGMNKTTKFIPVEELEVALSQASALGKHLRYSFIDDHAQPCGGG